MCDMDYPWPDMTKKEVVVGVDDTDCPPKELSSSEPEEKDNKRKPVSGKREKPYFVR